MKCDGSLLGGDACPNDATWKIHCTNTACNVDRGACDYHEIETRALIIKWSEEGGYCPFCDMQYTDAVHNTSRWYRITEQVQPVP